MKKILGVLGVALIAGVMFFSANNASSFKADTSLTELIGINNANAELDDEDGNRFKKVIGDCAIRFLGKANTTFSFRGTTYKIPVGQVELVVTFENVSTDCQTNGNSYYCEDYSCADFLNGN